MDNNLQIILKCFKQRIYPSRMSQFALYKIYCNFANTSEITNGLNQIIKTSKQLPDLKELQIIHDNLDKIWVEHTDYIHIFNNDLSLILIKNNGSNTGKLYEINVDELKDEIKSRFIKENDGPMVLISILTFLLMLTILGCLTL